MRTALDFATRGHALHNDDWSAWWCAVQWTTETSDPDARIVDAGAARIEQGKRPTIAQYAAADRAWHRAIDSLKK